MAESVLDRKLIGRLTIERAVYLIAFVFAIVLSLYELGERPYHHDESIHAFYSWKISREGVGSYRYDPVYHGLVLYYASAAVMLLGDNDFTGRLSAVLFGLGVLGFAWPLRRYLGRWGALSFLVLLVFSPAWLYFARFVRHDVYLALCNLAAIYFAFRYGETRRFAYLPISAAWLALGFATKEDNYLLTPIFLLAFLGMLVWEVLGATDHKRAAAAAWDETKGFFRDAWKPLLVSAAVFLVVWTVIYSAFFTDERYFKLDDPLRIFDPIRNALDYWIGQHRKERIGGPWWYYLPQLTFYDPLILFPLIAAVLGPVVSRRPRSAAGRIFWWCTLLAFLGFVVALFAERENPALAQWKIGGVALMAVAAFATLTTATLWVPDRFTRFAVLWALASLAVYGWAQEKVPWLLVPQLLPLALVAGGWYGRLIEGGRLRSPGRLAALGGVGALTVWTLINVNYVWDAPKPDEPGARREPPVRHEEMLSYVQSTYDIHEVMGRIEEVAARRGNGQKERLQISGNATWPFSWYLREYPVNWSGSIRKVDTCLVIVDKELERTFNEAMTPKYEAVPFQIRGWWTWEHTFPSLSGFVKWVLMRVAWSGVGSSDAVLYVQRELGADVPCGGVEVNPPPAAVQPPRSPSVLAAAAIWGGRGSGRGQFNEPRDLAVDQAGNVYVVDSKNHRVQKLGPNGEVIAVWGSKGAEAGQFNDPCGIALAPDGSVYVADTWNHRIQKFDPAGNFLLQWAEQDPSFWGPRGVAVASDGSVFVTDTGNKRVLSYTSEGERLHAWGVEGTGKGEFIEPVGIDVNAYGQIVVADTGNRRLQFFEPDGTFVQEWRIYGWEEFYTEPYIATHGDSVYATDSYEHRIGRYAGHLNLTGLWGGFGSGSGQFNRPIGIAVGPDDAVYVSDTLNHRIQKLIVPAESPGSPSGAP